MYEVEKSIGFLLSKAYQRSWGLLREEIEPYDLTPPQFALLAFLWQQDGLTQVEISEKAQVDRSTVGGLIDRLEKSGLLERRHHPQDRRAYKIYLTEQGKNLENPLSDCAKRSLATFTKRLSEEEVAELRRVLEILREDRGIYEFPSC
ncbi:MAG: MarR family transcriptional regulator [Desulfuromonadaceae bacterium]|nr:MarR family transcriptional regulator [Desulfuromonadaceae bacterium]